MILLRALLLIAIILLSSVPLHAQVREHSLANGLKVLLIEDHKAPLAVFQIWYRVGSRDEPSGKTGMSHLLEHMMFKGTPSYGSKQFSKLVQRLGGTDNAYTTKDYTMYYQRLPASKIDISIKLEADRMQNLILEEKEVIAERSVVMEERRMRYDDDPQNSLFEEVMAASFKAHPYQWPVIGWMSDIAAIGRDDLYSHYRAYYSPDNAFIVVAGDINPDDILKKIEASFGSIKPGMGKHKVDSAEPQQKAERRIYLKREAKLPYLLMVYHVPNIPEEDSYALEILATVLAGGESGRIYKSIIYDKKLAISAYADYSGLSKDPFLFYLGGTSAPGKRVEDLEKALIEEVSKIQAAPPSEKEVQKAKNQIESSFIMNQDSVFFQAEIAGMFEMMAGSWREKDRYLEIIRKVTPEDVQRAAKKYLSEGTATVGVLIPLDGGDAGHGEGK